MGRIRTCIGVYATTPYVIRPEGIRIYSYEELCYYLCTNVYILDAELLNSSLAEWIDRQLQLKELAKSLYSSSGEVCMPENYVMQVLSYGHYLTGSRLNGMLQIVRENARLNTYEKKKKRIDHLASAGCYEQAYKEYEELISAVAGKDIALTGEIYTAMGKIAARMFYFSLAEELFEKAYKLTYRRDSMLYYVCAVKMHGTPMQQKQKLLTNSEFQKIEPEAEHLLDQYTEEFMQTADYAKYQDMERMWNDTKPAEYYELIDKTTQELKEEYRDGTNSGKIR